MYRRAYVLLVGFAAVMGVLAIVTAAADRSTPRRPRGFPRPVVAAAAAAAEPAPSSATSLPRTLWVSRGQPQAVAAIARDRVRTHWTRERLTLVVMGIVCFYITYVSYRNLKSFLPFVREKKYDYELHLVDLALFLGNEPGVVLHDMLGTGVSAHVLSYIYLWFLPLVPLAVTAWLVWSRNISYGYWFVTSQCIAWSPRHAVLLPPAHLGPGLLRALALRGRDRGRDPDLRR